MKIFKPEKLKEARNGLTRREVVAALKDKGYEVTEQTLWKWEDGQTTPPADVIPILADIYKKSMNAFFDEAA